MSGSPVVTSGSSPSVIAWPDWEATWVRLTGAQLPDYSMTDAVIRVHNLVDRIASSV